MKKENQVQECESFRYLKRPEMHELFSKARSARDLLLLRMLYELGCTLKELLNLRVRDLDLYNNKVCITGKNSYRNMRTCRMSELTSNELEEYLNVNGLKGKKLKHLFLSSHGKPMTMRRLNQIISYYLGNIGFTGCNAQVIKYSHIIHAYESGVSISAIQGQCGLSAYRIHVIVKEVLTPDRNSYNSFFE